MKNILIIAHYCGELDGRLSNRFVYLANLLSDCFEVELITNNFYHTKKVHKVVTGSYPFKITLVKEPGYKKNISIKRLISHWFFGKNLERYLNSINKECIVYTSFPSITIANTACKFANRVGGKFVVDIQDLWPESFENFLGKNIVSKHLIKLLSRKVESLYNKSDAIIAVSNTFLIKAKSIVKPSTPLLSVYIGSTKYPSYNFDNRYPENGGNTIKLLYLGSLGQSYDLLTAIKAFNTAKIELKEIVNLEFDIIGEGPKKNDFEKYAFETQSSVRFLGLIDYTEVQKIIPDYDIALNPISTWSIASIVNKHGDYALASLPVLNTQSSMEYKELLKRYNCGLSSEPGDAEALSKNITKLCKDKNLLIQMRENSQKMASENFDRSLTYKKIENLLKAL